MTNRVTLHLTKPTLLQPLAIFTHTRARAHTHTHTHTHHTKRIHTHTHTHTHKTHTHTQHTHTVCVRVFVRLCHPLCQHYFAYKSCNEKHEVGSSAAAACVTLCPGLAKRSRLECATGNRLYCVEFLGHDCSLRCLCGRYSSYSLIRLTPCPFLPPY